MGLRSPRRRGGTEIGAEKSKRKLEAKRRGGRSWRSLSAFLRADLRFSAVVRKNQAGYPLAPRLPLWKRLGGADPRADRLVLHRRQNASVVKAAVGRDPP